MLPIIGFTIKKIANNESKAIEFAIQNNKEISSLESYAVIESIQKKTRIAKYNLRSSRPSFEQIKIPIMTRTKRLAFQPEF